MSDAGNIDAAAAALAADVAAAHGLDGNEQADLTNELLAAVDDFLGSRSGASDAAG